MIKKYELMLRIMDLELLCETYDTQINDLTERVKKLEKASKKAKK